MSRMRGNSHVRFLGEEAVVIPLTYPTLSMADLELLSIGLINDMYAESRNDDCKYAQIATQEDFDRF